MKHAVVKLDSTLLQSAEESSEEMVALPAGVLLDLLTQLGLEHTRPSMTWPDDAMTRQ